ncbi:dephospho-CoA kinase [candidate division KSB1 bacterium]|nr:dephospho-CoA kinase [candidate division KSB1 bacterium]
MTKLVVGVTGSPGCGKSTVSGMFEELGAPVIDVDEAGRWVVDNMPLIRRNIRREFGDGVFLATGELDRRKMGGIVFADKKELIKLNRIVHPFMINRVRQLILRARNDKYILPYIILDAALIFELKLDSELNYVITVGAPLSVRINRLCTRHGIDREQAVRMTESQLSQEEKLQQADFIIENTETIEILKQKVNQLHQLFTKR